MWIEGQPVKWGPETGWDGELVGERAQMVLTDEQCDFLGLVIDEEAMDELALDSIYRGVNFENATDWNQPEYDDPDDDTEDDDG